MSRGSVVSEEEKELIAKTAYALKEKNPQISKTEIAKKVNRDINTVSKIMSDRRFIKYKDQMKKRIDQIRFENIVLADKLVKKALENGEVKPYQAIGASKTYYEQSFGLLEGNGNINVTGNQVQVVRGNVSYNKENKEKPET